jgi:hypothetical protein
MRAILEQILGEFVGNRLPLIRNNLTTAVNVKLKTVQMG